MRERYASRIEEFEKIATKVDISRGQIVDHWEREDGQPKVRDFCIYLRLLGENAEKQNRTEEFENLRLDIIRILDPTWWRRLVSGNRTDLTTPNEYAQDLTDYTSTFDINRRTRLARVDAKVAGIGGSLVVRRPVIANHQAPLTATGKVFDISAVFPVDRSTITIQRRTGSRPPYLFSIDLRDQAYGVYNEAGKRALRRAFATDGLGQLSDAIQSFFHELPDGKTLSWRELVDGELIPLRWASGGILPVIRVLKKDDQGRWETEGDYVALFFRDIPPIGWNVGNGASESPLEHSDLEELIGREFAEELILLAHKPDAAKPVKQVDFYEGTGGGALAVTEQFVKSVTAHQELREKHDHIVIDLNGPREKRFLTPLSTPFAVRVMQAGESIRRCRDIIISVNPQELGIEAIRPYAFDLYEGEWLMDGEIVPSANAKHPFLLRRPIMLLRIDFLRENYKGKGLGQVMAGDPFLGGKQMCEIPAGAYRIFADLDEREARLRALRRDLDAHPDASPEQRQSWTRETAFIEEWLGLYGPTFREALIGEKPLQAGPATTFCPVTFKTIELAFRHRVFGFGG